MTAWPCRRELAQVEQEFEAESICYLACQRAGVRCPSDSYLADYLKNNSEVPQISLDRVLKATGLIEEMGRRALPSRKKG